MDGWICFVSTVHSVHDLNLDLHISLLFDWNSMFLVFSFRKYRMLKLRRRVGVRWEVLLLKIPVNPFLKKRKKKRLA